MLSLSGLYLHPSHLGVRGKGRGKRRGRGRGRGG